MSTSAAHLQASPSHRSFLVPAFWTLMAFVIKNITTIRTTRFCVITMYYIQCNVLRYATMRQFTIEALAAVSDSELLGHQDSKEAAVLEEQHCRIVRHNSPILDRCRYWHAANQAGWHQGDGPWHRDARPCGSSGRHAVPFTRSPAGVPNSSDLPVPGRPGLRPGSIPEEHHDRRADCGGTVTGKISVPPHRTVCRGQRARRAPRACARGWSRPTAARAWDVRKTPRACARGWSRPMVTRAWDVRKTPRARARGL